MENVPPKFYATPNTEKFYVTPNIESYISSQNLGSAHITKSVWNWYCANSQKEAKKTDSFHFLSLEALTYTQLPGHEEAQAPNEEAYMEKFSWREIEVPGYQHRLSFQVSCQY